MAKGISKSILQALSGKKAYSLPSLKEELSDVLSHKYAVTRAVKNMTETGLVETLQSDNQSYVRLTKDGRQKLVSLKLDDDTVMVPTTWDGKWRIVLLDLPESRKSERESLRYLLKKAGFVCLKNSAWISPFPFEYFFRNIKRDFNLSTEMIIITTDSIDDETEELLLKKFTI
jgi:DNA-binding transcriptional regulator PaaX